MATLNLDEGGAVCEVEYASVVEYRERLDPARMTTAQFLVGCAQVVVNNGQPVVSSPTVRRGKIKPLK